MSTPSGSTPSLTPSRSPSPEPPVQPAFFYNAEGEQPAPSPDATGRLLFTPEDDPLAQRGIPVFKPSMEEFQDFERYMERIECWGNRSGIVKIIPPKEWSDALPSVEPQLANVRIMSPIEQNFLGGTGRFRQQNIEKRRSMSVREWVELCSKDGYHAPSASEVGLHHAPVAGKAKRRVSRRATTETEATDVKEEDEAINVPASPPITDSHAAGSPKEEDEDTKTSRPHRRKTHKQVADEKAVKDVAFMAKFKPHEDWLPFGMQPSDYTPEYCKELERHYWRNCGMGKSPWYGADTQGSLFTPDTTTWNVSCLPSYLTRLLPSSSQGLPGVNTPYLYFGMWRATFAWHVEDMDLFSINYIHFGAPKFWYAIPQGRAGAFETTMRNFFPREPTQCSQFLRHKSFLVSPKNLASYSCRPNTLVQHAGEFVITYPRGYHAGFNLGLNCAESVNFALESWVKLGRKARACNCVGDRQVPSVRIDVDQLLQDRAAEDAGQAPQDAPNSSSLSTTGKKATQGKKRKAPSPASKDAEMPRAKRIKMRPPHAEAEPSTSGTMTTKGHTKSVTLKLGAAPVGEELFPCCLCVGREQEGLLRVQEPPVGVPTVALDLSRGWRAHELCARIVPETWVDEVDEGLGFREKVVFGVDAIEKARWQLKCTACVRTRAKAHGAPVQCTKGKCSKAFHISCAREGGEAGISFRVLDEVEKQVVLVDAYAAGGGGAMDVDGQGQGQQGADEGTVIKTIRKTEVEVLCSQHNPTVAASKKAAKQTRIRDQLRALPPLSRIKLRVSSGVFEVTLVRVLEEACAVEVIWDRGARREFRWGSVVFGATDMPVEQKPTELVEKEPYASTSQPYASTSQPYAPSASQGYGQQPYGAQPYASRPYQAPYHQTYYQAAASQPPYQVGASQPPYQPYGAQGSQPHGGQGSQQSHYQAAAGQVQYAPPTPTTTTPMTAVPAYQGQQAPAPSYQGQASTPAYQGQASAPAPPPSTTAFEGQATAYQGQATVYQGQASPPPAASGGFSYFGAAPTVQQYAPSTTGTQCAPPTPAPSSTQPSVAAQ
ncbi:jumonji superfamily protein, partial [Schizophyllum commune]